jgi:acetyltransferase (GNAT) family protein
MTRRDHEGRAVIDPPAILSSLDSQRFGINVARAENVTSESVPAVLSFFEQHDVELLIARCDAANLDVERALLGAGLTLLEAQIIYRGPLAPKVATPGIREAVSEDRAGIADLARDGFRDLNTHYHADPRLSPDACQELYIDWTLRGLSGEAADVVYVAEVDGRLAAFGMFMQTGDGEMRYLLASVASWAQGRGLYLALLDRGMAWGSDRGANAVIGIVPHGNIPAHRNLIKAGLRPVSSSSTFHGWRDRLIHRQA